MASNYNRKSNSSGSRKAPSARSRSSASRGSSRSVSGSSRSASYSANSSSRPSRSSASSQKNTGYRKQQVAPPSYGQQAYAGPASGGNSYQQVSSVRVGDLEQAIRAHRVQKSYRRYVIRIFVVLALVAALLVAGIVVYNSNLFMITNVSVKGVEHLTASAMTDLASVPSGTTLLRVDESGIKSRLAEEPWVAEVSVNRVFPDTLELAITERSIAAVVDVPVDNAQKMETWAIASDGMWLMSIPAAGTEEAHSVSPKVYEDAESVLKITSVPYGTSPEVGKYCDDENVNNALAIVDGFTTSLADQVQTVSATGTETTTLILKNGIEIAFGTPDHIRDKERVCLELMEKNPGKITYINVRVVDRPTWRSTE